MFNFFKSDKDKKFEAIEKTMQVWHSMCLGLNFDAYSLKELKIQIGAIMFFLGGIDYLCQSGKMDLLGSSGFVIKLLQAMGYKKDFAISIFQNFYINPTESQSKFALEANIEGGRKLADFIVNKNLGAAVSFRLLVSKWAENPDLDRADLALLE